MSGSKEEGKGPLLGGGARALGLGRGGAGAPDGGKDGRVEARTCRVVTLVGGIGGREWAGAWGGGAVTLCDRSWRAALISSTTP